MKPDQHLPTTAQYHKIYKEFNFPVLPDNNEQILSNDDSLSWKIEIISEQVSVSVQFFNMPVFSGSLRRIGQLIANFENEILITLHNFLFFAITIQAF